MLEYNHVSDGQRAILKNAQQALSKVMEEKEEANASKKQKQAVMVEILTPSPIKSAESSMKDSQKLLQRCHQCHCTRCT